MEMTDTIWCSDDLRVKKKTKDKKETRTVPCVAVLVFLFLWMYFIQQFFNNLLFDVNIKTEIAQQRK